MTCGTVPVMEMMHYYHGRKASVVYSPDESGWYADDWYDPYYDSGICDAAEDALMLWRDWVDSL